MSIDQDREIAFSGLMEECFQINRQLVTAAKALTDGTGITGAQWGVLGVFGGADEPLTVAQAARRIGLSRQGVQRVADLLVAKGLVAYQRNPNHQRAKLVNVTEPGQAVLEQLQARQSEWARQASGELELAALNAATSLIRKVRHRLVDQLNFESDHSSP